MRSGKGAGEPPVTPRACVRACVRACGLAHVSADRKARWRSSGLGSLSSGLGSLPSGLGSRSSGLGSRHLMSVTHCLIARKPVFMPVHLESGSWKRLPGFPPVSVRLSGVSLGTKYSARAATIYKPGTRRGQQTVACTAASRTPNRQTPHSGQRAQQQFFTVKKARLRFFVFLHY